MGKFIFFSLFLVLLIVLAADGRKRNQSKEGGVQKQGRRRQRKGAKGPARKLKSRKLQKKRRAGKKAKKQAKRKNRKKNSGGSKTKSQRKNCKQATSTFCPADKALSLKLLYGQVANFFRQLKRAENHAKIVSKKKDKKDVFASDAAILEDAVGGNLSAPSCSSASRSASTAGEKGETLANCSNSIGSACQDITVNTTLLGDCKTKMENFQTKIETCKTDDSCTCWAEAAAMKDEINGCKATDEMNRVKALKSNCLDKFGECKKAQDSAVEFTASCPTLTITTMAPGMTTMAAKRRNLIKSILAQNLIRHTV